MPSRIRHLHLLPLKISDETIRELRNVIALAEKGDVVGIAYVAVCRRSFFVNAVGAAAERPTLTRGMLKNLEDLVGDLQPRPPRSRR